MPRRFMLSHRHEPHECPVAFAAWRGFDSALRRHPTVGSCAHGDRGIGAPARSGEPRAVDVAGLVLRRDGGGAGDP